MKRRCDRTLTTELERLPDHPFHGRSLRVGRHAQRDETRVFPGALYQSAAVIELTAAIEEQRRMPREGADPNHVLAADRVANDLPHVCARAGRLAPITDLVRFRGAGLPCPAGRLYDGTHLRRDLLDVLRNGDFLGGRHLLVALWQLLYRPFIAVGIAEVDKPAPRQIRDIADRDTALDKLLVGLLDVRHHHLQTLD